MTTRYANPDLHCHSIFSDGTLHPDDVAALAAGHGVDLWSLTDHDGLDGQALALHAAHAHGMDYLSGVEVSVTHERVTVHIVGLGFDVANTSLIEGLRRTRAGRQERARRMGERFASLGIPGAYEGALQLAEHPEAIARPHFARFLVEQGVCKTVQQAFTTYLADGKPCDVPNQWATLADAVHWITGAGGMAILAHPARYRFSSNQEASLFEQFKSVGGQGVEVVTGCHSTSETRRYATMARRYGLLASRGSDFHNPGEGRNEPGTLASLPTDLDAVWSQLDDRIQRAVH